MSADDKPGRSWLICNVSVSLDIRIKHPHFIFGQLGIARRRLEIRLERQDSDRRPERQSGVKNKDFSALRMRNMSAMNRLQHHLRATYGIMLR